MRGVLPSASWLMLLALSVPTSAPAAGYFVSVRGSDSNPGTPDNPFRTIGKAAAKMRPGDTCWVRAGIYRETVRPARSGEPGRPITFRSFRREEAVVSGADFIGGWVRHRHASGEVYAAAMPWTMNSGGAGRDQVFVDGVMMVEARWPNIDKNPALIRREDMARSDAGEVLEKGQPAKAGYTSASLAPFGQDFFKGAKINFLPGYYWCTMTGDVAASEPGSVTFTYKFQDGVYYAPRENDRFFMWGTYELLDHPREWFRHPSGVLFLRAPGGDDPDRHLVEAKRREYVFDLRGRAHVTIQGLRLFAGALATDSASAGVVLDGIVAEYIAHYQEIPGWWYGTGLAIELRGPKSEIRNSRVAYSVGNGVALRGAGSKATNTVVHDVGYMGTSGACLSTEGDGFVVEHNTLYNSGGANVLDLRRSTRTKARFNDVSGSALQTIDGGAVMITRNFDGQDTEIAYNLIHDTMGVADGAKGYYGSAGIYLEGAVKNYVIHHNVIWNISGSGTSGAGICMPGVEGGFEGVRIYNNTVGATMVAAFRKSGGFDIRNNIYHQIAGGVRKEGTTVSNNATRKGLFSRLPPTRPGPAGPVTFGLMAAQGRAFVDKGAHIPPWTDGFAGAAPDVGALECGKRPFTAGADLDEPDGGGGRSKKRPAKKAEKERAAEPLGKSADAVGAVPVEQRPAGTGAAEKSGQAAAKPGPRERGRDEAAPTEREQHPELAALFKRAEALFIDGELGEAKALFEKIAGEHPDTGFAAKAREYLELMK